MLRVHPSLLKLKLDSLHSKMLQLAQGLSMQHAEVQQMCASQPQVLTFAPESTIAKVRVLLGFMLWRTLLGPAVHQPFSMHSPLHALHRYLYYIALSCPCR